MAISKRGSAQRSVLAAIGAYGLVGLMAPSAAMAAEAAAAPAAPAANEAVTQVETVIVTARRRNESVQVTPVAVTAFSPATLRNAAAPDIRDLVGQTPGLVLDQVVAGPSAAAISIRGISFNDIEKSFDPAVGVLIDDVYLGTNTGQLTDAFDLQSLEVLRGPQGSLFGRNTIGGVIKVERTKPTGVFGGYIDTTQGDYGRHDYHALLNLPEIGGQLSTKLFFSSRQSDGYEHNATLNEETPYSDVKRYGVDFFWKPIDSFDVNLTVEHERERSKVDQASLSDSNDLICLPFPGFAPANECNRNNTTDLYTTYSNKVGEVNNDENDVTAQANWRLGAVTLTSVTAYRDSSEHVAEDFDATSINFYDTVRNQDYHQFSQELRASGDFGKELNYVAGVYYFNSHYNLNQLTNLGPILGGAQATQLASQDDSSYAAFADVNWEFWPKFRLDIGGRYTRDEKAAHNQYPAPEPGAFIAYASQSWGEFTPKVSLDYRPSGDLLFYASFSQGYRSGGFNGRGGDVFTSETPYNPETVDSYEIGGKTEWFDHRLVFNVSIYDNEYHNKQEQVVIATPVGSPVPDETVVANAASAKIRGAEFELTATPVRHLTLHANLGLLDGSYNGFSQVDPTYTNRKDDLSTLQLRLAPKTTGGVGFEYKIPSDIGDWTIAADYRYVAKHQTALSPAAGTAVYTGVGCATNTSPCTYVPAVSDPRTEANATNVIDANLTWEHPAAVGSVRVTIFGRNLTDDRGLQGALPVAGLFTFGTPRPPRTWGVTLGYKF